MRVQKRTDTTYGCHIIGRKELERQQAVHREKLSRVKSTIDTSAPMAQPHLTLYGRDYVAKKRATTEAAFSDLKMIQSIAKTMTRTPQIPERRGPLTLNTDSRKMEIYRVMKENHRLLDRLESLEPCVSTRDLIREHQARKRYTVLTSHTKRLAGEYDTDIRRIQTDDKAKADTYTRSLQVRLARHRAQQSQSMPSLPTEQPDVQTPLGPHAALSLSPPSASQSQRAARPRKQQQLPSSTAKAATQQRTVGACGGGSPHFAQPTAAAASRVSAKTEPKAEPKADPKAADRKKQLQRKASRRDIDEGLDLVEEEEEEEAANQAAPSVPVEEEQRAASPSVPREAEPSPVDAAISLPLESQEVPPPPEAERAASPLVESAESASEAREAADDRGGEAEAPVQEEGSAPALPPEAEAAVQDRAATPSQEAEAFSKAAPLASQAEETGIADVSSVQPESSQEPQERREDEQPGDYDDEVFEPEGTSALPQADPSSAQEFDPDESGALDATNATSASATAAEAAGQAEEASVSAEESAAPAAAVGIAGEDGRASPSNQDASGERTGGGDTYEDEYEEDFDSQDNTTESAQNLSKAMREGGPALRGTPEDSGGVFEDESGTFEESKG